MARSLGACDHKGYTRSHRFVLGSDLVGHFDKLGEKLQAFDALLDALPADVAENVSRGNLRALLPTR
jgi:hypothetical protein